MGAQQARVVLIGLRRSGKTTAGGLLARRLGWPLIDTDALVGKLTGRAPADWIRVAGLEAFREEEIRAVATLACVRPAVIATGGGVPLSEKNRQILRESSLIAYLRADPWLLSERARAEARPESRPLLAGRHPGEEPFILFAERDDLYRGFCDLVVDAARTPESIADTIADHLGR